ncbi:hypothetical protein CC79DRAFT_1331269 [Sarocladium strictum]
MSSQTSLADLFRAVEQQQESYLQSLRALHENIALQQQQTPAQQHPQPHVVEPVRRRPRADSRITVQDASFTPPLRALSGPTFVFSSDATGVNPLSQTLPLPLRRSTLEAPSPRPFLPSTPLTGAAIAHDDDLNFIPLLDQTYNSPRQQRQQHLPSPQLAPTIVELMPRTTKPLVPMSFTDHMLLEHLRHADFGDSLSKQLEDVRDKRKPELDVALSFRDFAMYEREGYMAATFEVYDVAADASVRKMSVDVDAHAAKYYAGDGLFENPDGIVDAPLVWEGIKDVNLDGSSVGRITIVQEPTPLMLAALHLAMSPHFDMSELLEHFLSDVPRHRTHACLTRAFEKPPPSLIATPPSLSDAVPFPPLTTVSNIRQRSFFFVFKYYTMVGDSLSPAPWQKFDKRPSDKRLGDHIDIAECGSVLALSLGGEPTKPVRMRPRRERARDGHLYDTFQSWHVLSIQSFPDDQHTVRTDEFQQKNFYNGPYAFMDLLIAEYRDAGRRTQQLHEHITKLITPPTEFIFNRYLRDRLLFEDKHFSYIRRYFWAYNTLAVINTGIKAMVSAYADNFNDDFWEGTHQLLWPHPEPHSPEGLAYAEKMASVRRELEKTVSELGEVLKRNERTRKEIENLRDQLFSGTSIRESRRAIDQGDNIRILTCASMVFLPATFVVGIWGISEFKISPENWTFTFTMLIVCVPFIMLVFLLQTRLFTRLLLKCWTFISAPFSRRRRRDAEAAAVAAAGNNLFLDDRGSGDGGLPQGRKRRLMVVDGAKKAAGRWTLGGWRAGRTGVRGLEDGELGRV